MENLNNFSPRMLAYEYFVRLCALASSKQRKFPHGTTKRLQARAILGQPKTTKCFVLQWNFRVSRSLTAHATNVELL